ncbi:MAG: trypsin-like serine protease [Caldilineaceae bacterium]
MTAKQNLALLALALGIAALCSISGNAQASDLVGRTQAKAPTASARGEASTKLGQVNQHRPLRTVYAESDPDGTAQALYIIQLEDAPLATYQGTLAEFSATSPRTLGTRKLDLRSAASNNYRAYLASQQDDFLRRAETLLGRPLATIYHYAVVFNGVAVKLSPQEAAKLLDLAGVRSIQRSQWRQKQTDASPAYLGVPAIWNGSATGGLPGTKGEGVIVGVIDTGIWPEHPSFADDGSYPAPPARWHGECKAPADNSLPYNCNHKLIGIQYFLDGYTQFGPYDGLFKSGRDDDGHGTHTASTAAGNEKVPATIYGINRGLVSGMAPRAYIAVYKGLGPNGGTMVDLTAAIDKAVADGVDVINYSVGSNLAANPWLDADAQAYLGALEAGVFVATSAGNDGPEPSTIGSPANAPWVTTVGASYFNRLFLSQITLRASGGMSLTGLFGGTSTPGVDNFTLVDATGIADSSGNTEGNCEAPFAANTFAAQVVVLCQRRGVEPTWALGNFVQAGGAGAILLYNSSDNYDFNSYLHPIPAVVVLSSTGQQIKQFIAAHPGETIQVSFGAGTAVYAPDPRIPVDTVVGFSSRGPNIDEETMTLINVIKPDLTAPGIHILAGASPQHITSLSDGSTAQYGAQGQLFQVIQGTSMSSPHLAGVGALLTALHPDWSPTQIRSALMTTAQAQNQKSRTPDGDLAATPFDMGAGRIDLSQAGQAGLLLDESAAAFSTADPTAGGDPSKLNLPSLTQFDCILQCSWVRTVKNPLNRSVAWTISANTPPTLTVVAQPSSFSLAPGASQSITFTANVNGLANNQWGYGSIIFSPNTTATVAAHFPVAVRASFGSMPTEILVDTRRNVGRTSISGFQTVDVADLKLALHQVEPQIAQANIVPDPTHNDPYDLENGGIFTQLLTVPAQTKRLVINIVDTSAYDLDLFVGMDSNSNGQPDEGEEVCASANASFVELCDFPKDATQVPSGTYWILIQNWEGSGAEADSLTFATSIIGANNSGSIQVSGPHSATMGVPFALQVDWNLPNQQPYSHFGLLELIDNTTNKTLANLPVSVNRMNDDVSKEASFAGLAAFPGDGVTYTIQLLPEPNDAPSVHYNLTDTLPAGLTYVPNSASMTPTVVGNQLRWSLDVGTLTEITYSAKIDPQLSVPTQLVNSVAHHVDLPGYQSDITSSTLTVPDVVLVGELVGTPIVTPTQHIFYQLTVHNLGSVPAKNVIAETVLPPGTSYISGGLLLSNTIQLALGDIAGKGSKSALLELQPIITHIPGADASVAAVNQPQIIGGKEAQPGAWPWQVALNTAETANGPLFFYCGGTLITPNWVLTAAHCVVDPVPVKAEVVVGINRLSSSAGQHIPVSQIVVYPGYTSQHSPPSGDLALLRLAHAVQLTGTIGISGSVGLIPLARLEEATLVAPNIQAMVTGWGDRSNGEGDYPDVLHQVGVPLVSNATCRAAYDPLNFGPITTDMICAGTEAGGFDACYGDSGGPLMVQDGGGVWKQVGIVSSGLECAQPSQYGTYTRVPYYFNWIAGPGVNTYANARFAIHDQSGHSATIVSGTSISVLSTATTRIYLPIVERK